MSDSYSPKQAATARERGCQLTPGVIYFLKGVPTSFVDNLAIKVKNKVSAMGAGATRLRVTPVAGLAKGPPGCWGLERENLS